MLAVTGRRKKPQLFSFLRRESPLLAAVKAASWQLPWKALKHEKGLILLVGLGMCSQPLPSQLPQGSFFHWENTRVQQQQNL